MRKRKNAYVFIAAITLYGILSGLAAAGEAAPEGAGAPQVGAPAPGSPGDTLTREDKRMAYLVYKLLDKSPARTSAWHTSSTSFSTRRGK